MRYKEFIDEEVWHGTPHRFDQFSTDYLGTGEGFNTFGWGLYFASKRAIAEFYRKKLSRKAQTSGHVYRVRLPDEDTRYLLWDKRLAEQAKAIQQAALSFLKIQETPPTEYHWGIGCGVEANLGLSNAMIEQHGDHFEAYSDSGAWEARRQFADLPEAIKEAKRKIRTELLRRTGEGFYETLKWECDSAKGASLALLAAGIYGIKYFDGGSRGAKEGSYNYVLFDASHIEITEVE